MLSLSGCSCFIVFYDKLLLLLICLCFFSVCILYPAQGHINPMLKLAKLLISVTLRCSTFSTKQVFLSQNIFSYILLDFICLFGAACFGVMWLLHNGRSMLSLSGCSCFIVCYAKLLLLLICLCFFFCVHPIPSTRPHKPNAQASKTVDFSYT